MKQTSQLLLLAPLAIFGLSGLLLYWYFVQPGQEGPFHDNLVPELIGFCLEGFVLVGLLSVWQRAKERARHHEMWLSLRGVLRGMLSHLDIAFLAPNAEPMPTRVLEEDQSIIAHFMQYLRDNRLSLQSMIAIKKESQKTLELARDMIPVAAQLSAAHMRWWIAMVDSLRKLGQASTRQEIEQQVYLFLENMNEFDNLEY